MMKLDPRTKIILLILANAVIFVQRSLYIEIAWVAILTLLLILSGLNKSALKFGVFFTVLCLLQYVFFPIVPGVVVSAFYILVTYARKVFPCLMVGTLIVKGTTVREMTAAPLKWHVPYRMIMPVAVTIRYFPTLREEIGYIRDAMKMRGIRGLQRFESTIVPVMISATNTSEELSAAAVTRGIENPAPKTSLVKIRLRMWDFVWIMIAALFLAAAFLYR